jgi:hypothetical protein
MLKKLVLIGIVTFYGWAQTINMASSGWMLEGAVSDINKSAFDKECVGIVWRFENGIWKGYSSNSETKLLLQDIKAYDANFTLKQGNGFWIDATYPCVIDTNVTANNENPSNPFLGKKVGVYAGYFWEFYDAGLLSMTRDLYPNVPLQTARYTVINNNKINITWDNNHITDHIVFDDGLKADSNFTITGSDITNGATTFTIPEVSDINASGFGFTKEMLDEKTFYIVEENREGTSYLDSMKISATDVLFAEYPPTCTDISCAVSGSYDYNITDGKLEINFSETPATFSPYTLLQANNHAHNKYGYYNVQVTINNEIVNMRFYEDKNESIEYLNKLNEN